MLLQHFWTRTARGQSHHCSEQMWCWGAPTFDATDKSRPESCHTAIQSHSNLRPSGQAAHGRYMGPGLQHQMTCIKSMPLEDQSQPLWFRNICRFFKVCIEAHADAKGLTVAKAAKKLLQPARHHLLLSQMMFANSTCVELDKKPT